MLLGDDVLEGIVLPNRRVTLVRNTLADAKLALLSGRVHRARLCAGFRARKGDRTVVSCLSLPTRALPI